MWKGELQSELEPWFGCKEQLMKLASGLSPWPTLSFLCCPRPDDSIPTNGHTLSLQFPFGNKPRNNPDQRRDHYSQYLGLDKSAQLLTFTKALPSFSFPCGVLSPVTGSQLLSKHEKMQKCPVFTTGKTVLGWNSQNKEMEAAGKNITVLTDSSLSFSPTSLVWSRGGRTVMQQQNTVDRKMGDEDKANTT